MPACTAAQDDALTLRRILQQAKTIAVVGLSAEWHRPSYFAAAYMQGKGYRILPVNPRQAGGHDPGHALRGPAGRHHRASRTSSTCSARPRTWARWPPARHRHRREAACGSRSAWSTGTADAAVRAAGLDSVMNRCVKIEHARLFGGLHWAGVNTGVVSARRRA